MRREPRPANSSRACTRLYAGLVFIVTAALIVTPLLHRFVHRFHWDGKV